MERFKNTFERDIQGSDFQQLPSIIGRRYKFLRLIGKGSFGVVFISESSESGKLYATKVELARCKSPKLEKEYHISKAMMDCKGYPEVRYYWTNRQYNAMVMELLGESLDDLHKRANCRFSIVTVILIAIQTLHRIEAFHEKGFIHRDIKPENFLVGLPPRRDELHLIDYGLSKEYINRTTHQHIPFTDKHGLVGTLRYISVNVHKECEPSRRDDLISLAYLYVYFFKGMLPWQFKERMDPRERCNKIYLYKSQYPPEHLYAQMPPEFLNFYRTVSSLKFDEKPDYAALRQPFEALLSTFSSYDRHFDWIEKPSKRSQSASSNQSHNSDQTAGTGFSSATGTAGFALPPNKQAPVKGDVPPQTVVTQTTSQPHQPAPVSNTKDTHPLTSVPNLPPVPPSSGGDIPQKTITAIQAPTQDSPPTPPKQPEINTDLDDNVVPTGELTDQDPAIAKHPSQVINHVAQVQTAKSDLIHQPPFDTAHSESDDDFEVHVVEEQKTEAAPPYHFKNSLPASMQQEFKQKSSVFPEFLPQPGDDHFTFSTPNLPPSAHLSLFVLTSSEHSTSPSPHENISSLPTDLHSAEIESTDSEGILIPPPSPHRESPQAPDSPSASLDLQASEDYMRYFDNLLDQGFNRKEDDSLDG